MAATAFDIARSIGLAGSRTHPTVSAILSANHGDRDVPQKKKPRKTQTTAAPAVEDIVLGLMQKAGTPPQFAYAFRKTGLVGGSDLSAWPPENRREWEDAVKEYLSLSSSADGQNRPDPQIWHSDLAEYLALTDADVDQVRECLRALIPIRSRGMSVFARAELAAVLLASACETAYASAGPTGQPENAGKLYTVFEELILQRSRELYAQGQIDA